MNPQRIFFSVATLILAFFPFYPSMAATLYKLDVPVSTTGISGSVSSSYRTKILGGTKEFKAINRITNFEKSNDPCKMKVKMRHLNNYTETTENKSLEDDCNNDKITVGYTDTETYVRGIQACTNNGVIKGLRVWGSKLNRTNGSLRNIAKVEDKRPNCSRWHTKYYCPAGKVATQIEAIYVEDSLYNFWGRAANGFAGIKLICREVILK